MSPEPVKNAASDLHTALFGPRAGDVGNPEYGWAPTPRINPFTGRVQGAVEVQVESSDGHHSRLVLADADHPWHRLYHTEFGAWVDVELRVIVQQQPGGGFVQQMQVLPTAHTNALLQREAGAAKRRAQRAAAEALGGTFIPAEEYVPGNPIADVRRAIERLAASDDDAPKEEPREPKLRAKPRHQQKREQMQMQRQHARRHNGR
jgi:hypothetical protein